jgi:phosphoglycerol transferase MdoB-like AlkP superfamily enzyme
MANKQTQTQIFATIINLLQMQNQRKPAQMGKQKLPKKRNRSVTTNVAG